MILNRQVNPIKILERSLQKQCENQMGSFDGRQIEQRGGSFFTGPGERERGPGAIIESQRWKGVPYNGKSLGRVKELVVRMSERDIDYTDE